MRQCFVIALVLFVGCGSSRETETSKGIPPEAEELRRYEAEFRPSDYDVDVKTFFADLRKENERGKTAVEPPTTEPPVVVPGFRVQMLATSEIDEANAKKTEAEAAFPGEWFYIVFDPPTYKLRAGNFLRRADADTFARSISEQGYPDAWVVPERVIKNVLPRERPPQPEEHQPR